MTIAGYVRVSTYEQAKNGFSVGEQEAKIRQYCELKGWELGRIYSDPGYTGTNFDRPALQRLLSEYQRYDMVLVFRLDRLSRTQEGALHLVNEFQSHGVAFTSISEDFNTATPIGKAMLGIAAAFAELDHDTILERMALGREGRAREGLWRGGSNTPLGYDFIDGKLVINEDEAEQVRTIFRMYQEGYSVHKISVYMHGLYPNRYNQTNSVSQIIKNPLYKGVITYNGTPYAGKHEKIISEAEFDAVQALYKSRMDKMSDIQRNPFRATHLLTGLIICKRCGERYQYEGSRTKNIKYQYYTCRGKHPHMHTTQTKRVKRCDNKNYRCDKLEAMILQQIDELDFEAPKPKKRKDNKKALQRIDNQIERLIDLYTVDGISLEALQSRINGLRERREALTVVEEEPARQIPPKETVTKVLQGDDFQAKKLVIDALIDRIEIDGENIDVFWSF